MKTSNLLDDFRHPSAFIPLLMSLAAFAILAAHVLIFGTAREADEGTSAHLFQLLMVGQVPLVAYFALTARRRTTDRVLLVLGAQLLAAAGALAPVALLGL
jgi:hypothetical protein